MKRKVPIAAVAACILLTACQNPHERTLPSDIANMDDGTKAAIQKLSPDERGLLAKYEVRHTLRGDKPPAGMTTIGQAIQEQRDFDAEQAKREAEAAALKAKMQKEHDDAVARLNSALSVALVSKSYEESDFRAGVYDDTITMNIAFDNKTDKVISGIKGTATFKNMFGDVISRSQVTMIQEIGANSKYLWHGSRKFNKFESDDQTLRNTPIEKIKFEFVPQTIVYADGTQQTAPDVE